jgi:hypothetical protein
MIDPIILTDEILSTAEAIAGRYLAQWSSERDFPDIGDCSLTSPVDGRSRTVRFHLTDRLREKGKTVCGLWAPAHVKRVEGEGNTVVLDRVRITSRDLLQPVLLHEICHAVDPIFEAEWHELNGPSRPRMKPTHEENCHYLHEQRAFPGMWIGTLREEIAAGVYEKPGEAIARFRRLSEEFHWFCIATGDLMEQTERHIELIVADLRRRST